MSAIIAALYVALTYIAYPISYGGNMIDLRVSEALVVLPFFTPAAVPGLFIGCMIANLGSPFGILDIVIGSIATLTAAYATYKIKKPYLAPLPAVISNAFLVPVTLYLAAGYPYWLNVGLVGLGELICAYGLGLPLLYVLKKYNIFNKINQ